MAGSFCAGQDATDAKNGVIQNSKAYCEGALARSLEVTPTNPHVAGSEAATAWDAGVADKLADTVQGCCAPSGVAAEPA